MFFRQFLKDETACASYLFGCTTVGKLAVVDAHIDLVDDYVAASPPGIQDRGGPPRHTSRPTTSPG